MIAAGKGKADAVDDDIRSEIGDSGAEISGCLFALAIEDDCSDLRPSAVLLIRLGHAPANSDDLMAGQG
jgi:hypothetical protein